MNFYLVEIENFNRDTNDPNTLHLLVVAESYYEAVDRVVSVEEAENEEILSLKIIEVNDESVETDYIYLTEELYTKLLET